MKVTAIIPTYNRPASVRRTLEKVFALDPLPDEILVIDQSDREDVELRSFVRRAPQGVVVRCLYHRPPNAQTARNRAVRQSVGDVLLFLDDDVLAEQDLVSAHLRNYADPSIGAVGGFYLEPGEAPTDWLPRHYFRKHTGWIYLPHGYIRRLESGLFPSCNGSIRREVLIRVGGFDENYTQTHFDDTDLSCRLRALGIKIIHDPNARAVHLKEACGGKRPGGPNPWVIADAAAWKTWLYFFWSNFRWRSWREVALRFRGCVLRKVNLVRPWYLASALFYFVTGAVQAAAAIRSGRVLPLCHDATIEDEPQIAG